MGMAKNKLTANQMREFKNQERIVNRFRNNYAMPLVLAFIRRLKSRIEQDANYLNGTGINNDLNIIYREIFKYAIFNQFFNEAKKPKIENISIKNDNLNDNFKLTDPKTKKPNDIYWEPDNDPRGADYYDISPTGDYELGIEDGILVGAGILALIKNTSKHLKSNFASGGVDKLMDNIKNRSLFDFMSIFIGFNYMLSKLNTKIWATMLDAKVRPSTKYQRGDHRINEGEKRNNITRKFPNGQRFPHDRINQPIYEWINCRCKLVNK